jgi:hypothetical protein
MKKLWIISILLGSLWIKNNAQKIKIKAIPYAMHFENTPLA